MPWKSPSGASRSDHRDRIPNAQSWNPGGSMTLTLGIDRLLTSENSRLEGRRIGVVSNPTSVDRAFRHSVDRLASHPNAQVTALFGPQHGFHSDAQDNMIETPHAQDVRHGVPVYSLYSETREPTAEMLADVDVLVVDLLDVGTRVYTYIYTMANCLVSAARHGVDVIVCDRPNPIGGTAVEGPRLVPAFRSFVGQFPIPLRHGMTIGELARLFNEEYGLGASLEVVSMDGWDRSMYHDETGLPWVISSPNIPTLDTAIVYPGGVLFEGTNVSEGRGTTRPFELIGAPWIDPYRLTTEFERAGLPGVHVRPVWFEPTFHKHAGTACGGMPAARAGSRRVQAGRDRGGTDASDAGAGEGPILVARPPVRIRAREDADRHSGRIGSTAATHRGGCSARRHRRGLGRRPSGLSRTPRTIPSLLRSARMSRRARQSLAHVVSVPAWWPASDPPVRPRSWPGAVPRDSPERTRRPRSSHRPGATGECQFRRWHPTRPSARD